MDFKTGLIWSKLSWSVLSFMGVLSIIVAIIAEKRRDYTLAREWYRAGSVIFMAATVTLLVDIVVLLVIVAH